ncbi:universal stress protein [Limibacter armeniacum]|uniref:universal stress protein n=1 Tax=Limibacter armeniacum TaxID=466084 RepID=UPI002FE5804A
MKYKRILIACDGSAIDDRLFEFVRFFNRQTDVDHMLYVVQITKSLELPEEVEKKYPGLLAPVDEGLEYRLRQKFEKHLGQENIAFDVIIREGKVAKQLLQIIKEKDIDLIVMGKKKHLKGNGTATHPVSLLAQCSTAYVPETLPTNFSEIVVPVDFSETSKVALEAAVQLGKTFHFKVVCQHVYDVPSGYSSIGKTYEEFAEIMCKNAEHAYEVFTKDINTEGVELVVEMELLDEGQETSDKLCNMALKHPESIMIMGSQGRTKAAAFFFGSNADRILRHEEISLPTFVVKDPSNQIDFFEAIQQL